MYQTAGSMKTLTAARINRMSPWMPNKINGDFKELRFVRSTEFGSSG
jgi:hypothetical protein